MALECAYPKCPELGENKSMAVKACDVESCCGVLHHFCLIDWCTEMKVPELPSGIRYCWNCAVSLTLKKPAAIAVDLTAAAPPPECIPLPVETPEAVSGEAVGPSEGRTVEEVVKEVVEEVVDEASRGAEAMVECPRCAASLMACMLASHKELCTVGTVGTVCAVAAKTGGATGGGTAYVSLCLTVLPDLIVRASLAAGPIPVKALAQVVGTRCSWAGRACIVWCAMEGYISLIFDDMATEWQTVKADDFAAKAVPLRTAATVDTIDHVLTDKTTDTASRRTIRLPSGLLQEKIVEENGWQAFLSFRPVPGATVYATPPIAFPVHPGHPVLCTPPFVSVPKGTNAAPTPKEWVEGIFCGVLIGDEYNSSKGKTEQRRWALAVVEGTECFMPLGAISEIPGSAEGPRRMSRDECVAACKRAAQGRKPSSLHTMMQSAKHRKSLGDIEVQFTPGVRGGLRTRRNTIVVPSPAAAPSPADTCFGDSSAAAETAPSGVVLGVPASGIPLRLLGWGETKLMKQTVAALQLSLAENQISASAAESRSKASLIRLLLKRYASM